MKIRPIVIYSIFILITSHLCLFAQEKYKKFERTQAGEDLLKISIVGDKKELIIYEGDNTEKISFKTDDVSIDSGVVYIKNRALISAFKLVIGENKYAPDDIDRLELDFIEDGVTLGFQKEAESLNKFRRRKKNEIKALNDILIERDRFVRGAVISFWSNIEIRGEVNEDVVAIFGNIVIADSAVIRGDVIAIDGNVDLSPHAMVYGEIFSTGNRGRAGYRRGRYLSYTGDRFATVGKFRYNRVDGAAPYLGLKYDDEDSTHPRIMLYGGYAFASDRWRWMAGLEQSFFQKQPLTIGGRYYRRLASPDDWFITETANTFFALLATEDYKDYYEAEGGYGFIKYQPLKHFNIELGITTEKLMWLDGHKNLWSLFGGSKKFPTNFSTIESSGDRLSMIDTIDDKSLTTLKMTLNLDNREETDCYGNSFWKGILELELAPDSWNDNFDFGRYYSILTRFQRLDRHSGLQLALMAASSSDDLPVFRKFYMGGYGTFYGYNRREFMGTELWYIDLGYRYSFFRSSLAGWIIYNAGQVADDGYQLSEAEVKHSIGVGLSIEDELRLNIARRLDRSDASFKFSAMLSLHF